MNPPIPGWTKQPLKELAEKITKGTTPTTYGYVYKSEGVLFVKAESLDGLKINRAMCAFVDEAAHNAFKRSQLEPRDILFTIAGTLGRTAIVGSADVPANTNQAVALIRLKNAELVEYVARFLSYCGLGEQLGRGTGLQNLNLQQVADVEIPIPPPLERLAILKKVDALLSGSTSAHNELAKVPKLVERYSRAILSAAFRGDLTAEWRRVNKRTSAGQEVLRLLLQAHANNGGHKIGNASPPTEGAHMCVKDEFPHTWDLGNLRDIVQPTAPITYGILKPGPDFPGGIPYIRVADFPNDQLNVAGLRRTSPAIDNEFRRARLQKGDVLLSIRGTVGRVCRVPAGLEGANITQDSARLRFQSEVLPEYVEWMLRTPQVQSAMQRAIKGVAVRGINIGDVRALQIPIPPYEEQLEIVVRIQEALERIERMRSDVGRADAMLKRFEQATLASAFRGELVRGQESTSHAHPQGPVQ
jgi:type I restriction enzyme S subunit